MVEILPHEQCSQLNVNPIAENLRRRGGMACANRKVDARPASGTTMPRR